MSRRLCRFWLCRLVGHRPAGGVHGFTDDPWFRCARTGLAYDAATDAGVRS